MSQPMSAETCRYCGRHGGDCDHIGDGIVGDIQSCRDALAERVESLQSELNAANGIITTQVRDLEACNSLAREFGYGQGELDNALAGCLRKSVESLTRERDAMRTTIEEIKQIRPSKEWQERIDAAERRATEAEQKLAGAVKPLLDETDLVKFHKERMVEHRDNAIESRKCAERRGKLLERWLEWHSVDEPAAKLATFDALVRETEEEIRQ